ncbi:nuclease-related domain-containing protein [Psychrobacillus sp. NPDC058041]|uniref:nuclease-related domain-containing protein n=1 Tax=Psychrobacillus sp. NPDC058041 TaxID=3346310 RepID=UPI0036DE4C5A
MRKEHHALLKRLSDVQTVEFIQDEIRKIVAGERGENRLVQKLAELRLAGPVKIFPNVSLAIGEWKVQIDCLIVTDRCFIVLESKNYSGDLYVDLETEEFYKITEEGIEISLPNPYFQLMKHIRFIKDYFGKDVPNLKVTGAVLMTAKSGRIRRKPPHYPFYKLESVNEKVIHMYNHSNSLQLSTEQLQTIEQIIQTEQTPFTYPPLCEHYHISPKVLIPGVECPHCGVLGMKRFTTTWTCLACKKNDRYAHISAVNDYFSLIKMEITNKEFRKFCGLESIYSASRMLNSMNLESYGSGPARYFAQRKDN